MKLKKAMLKKNSRISLNLKCQVEINLKKGDEHTQKGLKSAVYCSQLSHFSGEIPGIYWHYQIWLKNGKNVQKSQRILDDKT